MLRTFIGNIVLLKLRQFWSRSDNYIMKYRTSNKNPTEEKSKIKSMKTVFRRLNRNKLNSQDQHFLLTSRISKKSGCRKGFLEF